MSYPGPPDPYHDPHQHPGSQNPYGADPANPYGTGPQAFDPNQGQYGADPANPYGTGPQAFDPNQGQYGGGPANPYGTGPHAFDPGQGQLEPFNQQTGGWQAMQPGLPAQQGGEPIAYLGDITVTATEVITPSATFPLAGSQWTMNNMTHVQEKMATWALVVALVGFFFICVFSLFFLLVKETNVQGAIQVTVRSGQHYHVTMIPVHNRAQIQQITNQFAYVRSMASS